MRKRSGENLTFAQRKQRRIQEKQPNDRVPAFVYGGCTIGEMKIWAHLDRDQTKITAAECQHATVGLPIPVNISRISKRCEQLLLACDCNQTLCGYHEAQQKKNKKK